MQKEIDGARQELYAVFSAKTLQERQDRARSCMLAAETLADEDDPVGATAALFAIAAAPLAEAETDLSVPAADRVENLPTPDLLLITRVLLASGRVAPVDQLLDLLLTRDDGLREECLILASAVRLDLGRDEEVLAYANELMSLNREAASPYRMQAMVYRRHGRWDHYVQALENAQKRMQEEDPILLTELIDGYVRIGRFDDAHREFDKLEANHPELVKMMPIVHAELLIHKGDTEQADQILTEYLASDPADVEALVVKGKLLVDAKEFEKAIEVLETALKYDPSAHDAHFQLGQAYARTNKMDLANDHLTKHRKLLDAKVRMYELEQKAAREPGNVAVRRELAQMYAEIQLPELAAFWERAASVAEDKK